LALPLGLLQLAQSGFAPVWEALVEFPLHHYPGFAQCRYWASAGLPHRIPHAAFPRFVGSVPGVLLLGVLRSAWVLWRDRSAMGFRRLTSVTILPGAAVASIYYCPNFTHLAIIASLCMPIAAEVTERLLRNLPFAARIGRPLGAALVLLLAAPMAKQMAGNLERQRALSPLSHDTAFGRVDLKLQEEPFLVDAVRARTHPGDEIFVYPTYSSLYLMSDTRNATPYQTIIPNYSTPEQIAEIIDLLEDRRVSLVVVQAFFVDWVGDPLTVYLDRNFTRESFAPPAESRPAFMLFQRRGS
jgi:hypothetical protein